MRMHETGTSYSNNGYIILHCPPHKSWMWHKMHNFSPLSRFTALDCYHHIVTHYETLQKKHTNWTQNKIESESMDLIMKIIEISSKDSVFFTFEWIDRTMTLRLVFVLDDNVLRSQYVMDPRAFQRKYASRIDFVVKPLKKYIKCQNSAWIYPNLFSSQPNSHLSTKFAQFCWFAANYSKIIVHSKIIEVVRQCKSYRQNWKYLTFLYVISSSLIQCLFCLLNSFLNYKIWIHFISLTINGWEWQSNYINSHALVNQKIPN